MQNDGTNSGCSLSAWIPEIGYFSISCFIMWWNFSTANPIVIPMKCISNPQKLHLLTNKALIYKYIGIDEFIQIELTISDQTHLILFVIMNQ